MGDIFLKAIRKIPNVASNDFNDESEYKTQKVKIIADIKYYNGEKGYVVKDYNNHIIVVKKEDIVSIETLEI